jgi:MFS transporter, OFA family, oxalate/formate antiporter
VPPSARRWLVVLALFVVTYGISTPLAAFGVFLPVLAETFGWSRGAIATALSLNLLLGGLAGFVGGALADRHGPRVMLAVTVALAGTAFALVSVVGALWQLYLFVGLLGGVGMSSFYLLAATTVSHWFHDHRGLALALVLVGFNLGYISAGPLAAWLIDAVGWRPAYALLGTGCGLVTLLASLTVRLPSPAEATRLRAAGGGGGATAPVASVTLRDALTDRRQWYLNVSWFLMGGLALMVSVHAVPFARDLGIGLASASLALTAYGLGAVTGRVGAGVVADRLGAPATIRTGYVLQLVALAALLWVGSRGALMVALVVFGVGFAATDTVVTKVIPDVFGLRAIGAIMGVLTLGWRCGAALGPAAAGFLYDATGTYGIPFGAAPVAVVMSWGFFNLATRRHRDHTRGGE